MSWMGTLFYVFAALAYAGGYGWHALVLLLVGCVCFVIAALVTLQAKAFENDRHSR